MPLRRPVQRIPHPDDFSVEDMKPTARAVKDQEMAIRRAYEMNEGMLEALEMDGTIRRMKELHRSSIMTNTKLRNIFTSGTPQWKYQDVWEWTVDHWYSGALRRSVEDSMHNITTTNQKTIKGKLDDLL